VATRPRFFGSAAVSAAVVGCLARPGQDPLGPAGRRRRYRFKGEEKLQFEVNGQDYFLNFAEDEAYWYVLVPSLTGVQRLPVYVDSPSYERFGILGKNSRNIQN
jgi:hypothetical protein